jgi:hypothetical protein
MYALVEKKPTMIVPLTVWYIHNRGQDFITHPDMMFCSNTYTYKITYLGRYIGMKMFVYIHLGMSRV